MVNEIKSDLRDGKVNWSKFSQMGRSAAIVLDCSRIAPTLPVEKMVERAILNVPILDEDVSSHSLYANLTPTTIDTFFSNYTASIYPFLPTSTSTKRQTRWRSISTKDTR